MYLRYGRSLKASLACAVGGLRNGKVHVLYIHITLVHICIMNGSDGVFNNSLENFIILLQYYNDR